ncbi:MAG: O-antigen ligase family protein [Gemmatimonadales bacterium]|nr:O-antigen ligase family protein [Gemmatimonadales bacterium]
MTISAVYEAEASAGAAEAKSGSLTLVRNGLQVALALLTIMTISRVHQQFPAIASIRPAMVLTFLVAIFAYLNPRLIVPDSLLTTWPAKVLRYLVIWTCLSVAFGISMGNSGQYVITTFSKNVIYAFLLVAAIRNVRDLYTFACAYIAGSLVLTFNSLFVFKLVHYSGDFSYARLSDMYTWDANDVVCVLMVALALSLLVLQVGGKWMKVMSFLTIIGIAGTVSRSGSRGGLVGILVVGLAVLLLARGISVVKRVAVLVVSAGALFAWAPPGYWMQMETLLKPKEDYNYTSKDGRRELFNRGIGYIAAYPVFGLGINNFPKAECEISEKAKIARRQNTGLRCTPPHNSVIQAGSETGIPGLLLWVGLLIFGFGQMLYLSYTLPKSWLKGTPEQRFLALAPSYLAIAIVGFASTAFFLNFAWLEIYYFIAAMMAGYLACLVRFRNGSGALSPVPHILPTGGSEWRSRRGGSPVAAPVGRLSSRRS